MGVRIVAQFAKVAGGSVFRAVSQAFAEAAADPTKGLGKAVSRRMSKDEACRILEVCANNIPKQTGAALDGWKTDISERATTMIQLNALDGKGVGSRYLQDRIRAAQRIVMKEVENWNISKLRSE